MQPSLYHAAQGACSSVSKHPPQVATAALRTSPLTDPMPFSPRLFHHTPNDTHVLLQSLSIPSPTPLKEDKRPCLNARLSVSKSYSSQKIVVYNDCPKEHTLSPDNAHTQLGNVHYNSGLRVFTEVA